jgi:hypothetical protein
MNGWQPIETAPRDGTPVLAWFQGSAVVAFLNPRTGRWDDGDFYDDLGSPSHWMPIPPAPETA